MPGGMGVAGQRVQHENGVIPGCIEGSIGFIGYSYFRQNAALFQEERAVKTTEGMELFGRMFFIPGKEKPRDGPGKAVSVISQEFGHYHRSSCLSHIILAALKLILQSGYFS